MLPYLQDRLVTAGGVREGEVLELDTSLQRVRLKDSFNAHLRLPIQVLKDLTSGAHRVQHVTEDVD